MWYDAPRAVRIGDNSLNLAQAHLTLALGLLHASSFTKWVIQIAELGNTLPTSHWAQSQPLSAQNWPERGHSSTPPNISFNFKLICGTTIQCATYLPKEPNWIRIFTIFLTLALEINIISSTFIAMLQQLTCPYYEPHASQASPFPLIYIHHPAPAFNPCKNISLNPSTWQHYTDQSFT